MERCEEIITTLNQNKIKEVQTIIREVPVYIEKDLIVEVPVPIYINNKEEKLTLNQPVSSGSQSLEDNSIAVHEESLEIDQSEVVSSAKKSEFKIDNEVRSYRYVEEDSKKSSKVNGSNDARSRRIKEIVEVPVYI